MLSYNTVKTLYESIWSDTETKKDMIIKILQDPPFIGGMIEDLKHDINLCKNDEFMTDHIIAMKKVVRELTIFIEGIKTCS